jgi:CxxC motif-containing protein (DUF1111 family)
MRSTWSHVGCVVLFAVASSAGCGGREEPNVPTGKASRGLTALGGSLPGISDVEFAAAKANFQQFEGIADGLGPIFNERGCAACHTNGQIGGAGQQVERRFGRFVSGAFDPLAEEGGSLRQLFSLGNFNNPAFQGGPPGNPSLCSVPVEVEPADATVRAGRLTTPLFGLGLVDAMPDSFFDALAAAQPAAIRGVARRFPVLLPDVQDGAQIVGGLRIGRFGWKANVPTLQQFAADAYLNEMGITTQSCVGGRSINDFATESAPNGTPMPVGCDDLAPLQPAAVVAATGIPVNTDDVVGDCSGNRTEIQDDIANFFTFMTFLAPPGPDAADRGDAISIARGSPIFDRIGCAGCHVRTAFRTPPSPPTGVPGGFVFHPFSDFLVHDMGALGDGIGAAPGDTPTQARSMRTAPLWGIRVRNRLLHDGRTSDVAAAIRAHDGQGAAARDGFGALSADDQHAVVQFVRSIAYDSQ